MRRMYAVALIDALASWRPATAGTATGSAKAVRDLGSSRKSQPPCLGQS